jgi:hypothetical protein
MRDSQEKMKFLHDVFWKVYFSPKVGMRIALNSKP